ncbi:MAG: ABC transporter ATP-binding protein [Lentimicrobiaceae bacterium]|nr:ABC transporter ATP-binding protein [Lentimicrobiaceae bacterium]
MIEIQQLHKSFDKEIVLYGINLTIRKGSIYTLLGRNGAGKTTLIDLVLDLIQPDSGKIYINQRPHHTLSRAEKSSIGVVGENLALIEEFSGYDFLKFVGRIYKLPSDIITRRLHDLFNYFFEDTDHLKKSISTYSTGMKKKVAFCAAVMHTPEILILDEPFSGLDPLAATQMIEFLKLYASKERTLFISSHDLNYVEKIATHIGVLENGNLLFNDTLESFTKNGQSAIDRALLNLLKPGVKDIKTIDWI